jgi:hypothetical protein
MRKMEHITEVLEDLAVVVDGKTVQAVVLEYVVKGMPAV